MSEAAETLDGWYSLHLFYAVDWATFRLVPEDEREAMINEFKHSLTIKLVLENNKLATTRYIILQVKKLTFYYGTYVQK